MADLVAAALATVRVEDNRLQELGLLRGKVGTVGTTLISGFTWATTNTTMGNQSTGRLLVRGPTSSPWILDAHNQRWSEVAMYTNERDGQGWDSVDVGGQTLGDLVEQLPDAAALLRAAAGRVMDDVRTIESPRRERRRRDLALELARTSATPTGPARSGAAWPPPPSQWRSSDCSAESSTPRPPRSSRDAPGIGQVDGPPRQPDCNTGNDIERENRRPGTGGKPLSAECARLAAAKPR